MLAVLDSEWAIILVVVALIVFFGGSKLPKLFHSLGSAQAEYKRGLAEGQARNAQNAQNAQATETTETTEPPSSSAAGEQANGN